MITIEQLKDVKERTAALERYLDIENKLVQVEEEQLRPDFGMMPRKLRHR